MKITTPQDMNALTEEEIFKIISKFEEGFLLEEKGLSYYHLVISGEIPRKICDKIEEEYIKAGWSKAICKTSSENGERAGLTGLQLWA
jgi:hypothetical protein